MGSFLEARLVDDADFLKTMMGSGRRSIGLEHTWWLRQKRNGNSSRNTGLDGKGLTESKREKPTVAVVKVADVDLIIPQICVGLRWQAGNKLWQVLKVQVASACLCWARSHFSEGPRDSADVCWGRASRWMHEW